MRKPKIKFNQINPGTGVAKILISVAQFGDISRVYSKNKKAVFSNLCRLKKRGLIKSDNSNGNNRFLLTKEGLIEFLKLELSQVDLLPEGKCCMVVFDIPEISRALREVLTIFLEDSCFIRIQKSVWISPFDAADLLARIFYLLEIDNWVRVFIVEERSCKQNNVDRRYSVVSL